MLTPRRSDARRNREAILQVAGVAFTDCPRSVPLDEIARRAGLARATVYRHFPDRHALATAVAEKNLEALRCAVDAATDEGRSFRDLLHWVLATQTSMRPLATLMLELPRRDQQRFADEVIGILAPPFLHAQVEGQLRDDLKPADLTLIMLMVNAAVEALPVGDERKPIMDRLIFVILDGVFTRSEV
ncbi:TetR/AcrR family transcriptional regulator [Parafrankia elaeagni]|uniref:TetR/AcrR family transcriptional regulator n=1 Tax=Parafrankia elaeagni TaxID=222534 RepID=UPI000553D253|nr:TetR/AcrR family transcriptional regulator [Parafrankia elaeagni]